jgi:hypothetical protein
MTKTSSMSHANGYIKFYTDPCHFSFETVNGETRLTIGPLQKPPLNHLTSFALTIADHSSRDQSARRPLPAHLMTQATATDIFLKAVGQFLDRKGYPLDDQTKFPHLPVKVTDNSQSPGYKQAVMARHIK